MKILLLLPLLLGFSVPAIAHNEANGGEEADCRGLGGYTCGACGCGCADDPCD